VFHIDFHTLPLLVLRRILVTSVLTVFTPCFSQLPPKHAQFRHLSADNGLSNNQIRAILQDKEGFMWIGTADGLNRYDGHFFHIYRHDPSDSTSIVSGEITCLLETLDGRLWIGSNEGVCVFNKQTDKFKTYLSAEVGEEFVSCNLVNDLLEDKKGHIWISTYGCGIKKLDPASGRFQIYNANTAMSHSGGFPVNSTTGFHRTGENTFLASSFSDGSPIYTVNTETVTFTPLDIPNFQSLDQAVQHLIYSVFVDSEKRIWIGNGTTTHGIDIFDPQTKKIQHYDRQNGNLSANIMQCWLEDSRGNFWVGTQQGLDVLNPAMNVFENHRVSEINSRSISDNDIKVIYEDRQGLVWVGTATGGLNIYDYRMNQFKVYSHSENRNEGLITNKVYTLLADSLDRIWIGGASTHLSVFTPTSGKFEHLDIPLLLNGTRRYPFVNTMAFGPDRRLWFGSASLTLGTFDTLTNKFSFPEFATSRAPHFIYKINVAADGTIWVGTPGGLSRIDPFSGTFKHFAASDSTSTRLTDNEVQILYTDSKNSLWIGTRVGGLHVLDTKKEIFSHFIRGKKSELGLSESLILSFLEGENGLMWMGTAGGGLNAMIVQKKADGSTKGKFYAFTKNEGLANNVVASVIEDGNGDLWLGTGNGLCRFTPPSGVEIINGELRYKTGEKYHPAAFRNFYKNDGLPDDDFIDGGVCKTSSGEIYFGTQHGLLEFHPDSIQLNPHKPPVYITSLSVFEKPYELDSPVTYKKYIELPYDQNFLSFEFIGLDFAQPEKNHYAYKLEGLNDRWIYCDHRRYATFTNLDPGEYTFRVKASNNDGLWNEDGAWIRILITPPFWRTLPFYSICGITSLLLLFSAVKFRERKLIRDKKNLEDKVATRTRSLQLEKEKVEFANAEISEQKNEIDKQRKNILDSINYASKIQIAMMKSEAEIAKHLGGCFILFKPKDLVSGDFYWYSHRGDTSYIAAIDCTGHGVPGALMSMIGHSLLNQIVNERKEEDLVAILNALHLGVVQALQQGDDDSDSMDGMDLAFLKIDHAKGILSYAGAMNPLYLVTPEELKIIKGTFASIGGKSLRRDGKQSAEFVSHSIDIKNGMGIYLFSDGFIDQFGGTDGESFGTDRFRTLLLSIQHLESIQQKEAMNRAFGEWKGERDQIDDVLVIGIRLNAV